MEKLLYRLKTNKFLQMLTIFVRYVLGAAFVYASIFKIRGIRFTPRSGENTPIDSLPHLLESMYRSGFYWYFAGWGQLIAGCLLMSHVFSTLGAVAYFPIMLNIFILTLSFQSPMVLLVTSLMLLANVYLLLWDWNRLKFVVLNEPGHYVAQSAPKREQMVWCYIGLLLFVTVVMVRLLNTKQAALILSR